MGPPPLPNALHFIIEALIVGISLFRANEIQDREHIFGLQPQEAHNFAALDLEFHITIARASGNSLLFDLVSMIRGQLVGGLSQVLLLPNAIPLSFKEHTAIFKAIEQRDADASREARHAHLDAALSRYRTALGKRITNAVQTSSPAKGRARKLVR